MTAAALTVLALAVALAGHRVTAFHAHLVEHIDRRTRHLEGVITMSAQDTIDAVVAKLAHAKAEVTAKLADLQAQIDAGVPAEQLDLGPLTAIAQSLDDIVPDAPAAPDSGDGGVPADPVA